MNVQKAYLLIYMSRNDDSETLLSFLVPPSSTYVFRVGVEGFCNFIWSHSSTHHSR
jgi:hypothetical protein